MTANSLLEELYFLVDENDEVVHHYVGNDELPMAFPNRQSLLDSIIESGTELRVVQLTDGALVDVTNEVYSQFYEGDKEDTIKLVEKSGMAFMAANE